MGRKLVITLDEATTAKYFELAIEKTEAEVDGDCEPSGTTIIIDISPPLGCFVSVGLTDIGMACVDIVDD